MSFHSNVLIDKVLSISALSEESKAQLSTIIEQKNIAKNHFILQKDEVSDYIYFLKKGVIRIFYKKHDKEITEWLAFDEEFFLSIASFYKRIPSYLSIQALENSEIFVFPHDNFMRLCAQYHDIETLHRKMLLNSLLLSQERMDSIQFETAQQRYEKLITERPEVIQKVPLTYISSFLGITLETLSRIRAK
jgi:CRP-like cAMP-binding protein